MADYQLSFIGQAAHTKAARRFAALGTDVKLARIRDLCTLSNEELCEQHPDATELPAPEACAVAVWSYASRKWLSCPHEARWLLDNNRYNAPPIKGCAAGVAGFLRSRLHLDSLAVNRGMA